jgi:(p)ppGpp synthase/HD superfamily hydrolase
LHRDQTRKGNDVPYVSHLLAVAALVLEYGGTEDQAIAGLLHDALEDQPDRTSTTEIATRFGDDVARIVAGCSDTTPDEMRHGRPPWLLRKQRYLDHLEIVTEDVLLVSCADKLHNAQSILRDLRTLGAGTWARFNAGRDDQLWYLRSLAAVFARRLPGSLADELARTVAEIERLA